VRSTWLKTELASTSESEEKKNAIGKLGMRFEKNVEYINKIVADLQDYARIHQANGSGKLT